MPKGDDRALILPTTAGYRASLAIENGARLQAMEHIIRHVLGEFTCKDTTRYYYFLALIVISLHWCSSVDMQSRTFNGFIPFSSEYICCPGLHILYGASATGEIGDCFI